MSRFAPHHSGSTSRKLDHILRGPSLVRLVDDVSAPFVEIEPLQFVAVRSVRGTVQAVVA